MKIPHMHRFPDLAGSPGDSRITPPAMLPSACHDGVGTPIFPISRLNSWPVRTPVHRFAAPSRVANAWLGATVGRYSFGVGLFHPHLHAGLSRRFPWLAVSVGTYPLWRRALLSSSSALFLSRLF